MLTNINTIKVCKLLYICVIIYDVFYWIEKLQYYKFLFQMYSTKFLHTDAAPDARLLNHLVKFSKSGFTLILSKTHLRY